MQFITRFVAFFPDADDAGRAELARVGNLVSTMNCQPVRKAPYVLAVDSSASLAGAEPSAALLDVFPGTAASARLAAANFEHVQSLEDVHRKAETCAQCYNLLQSTEDEFLLESDALGLKPVYTARTPGGNVVASRIADILRLFPVLAKPVDTVAVYEQLRLWAPLAGRTLHQHIRRTLPGGRYRWTPAAGFSGERTRDLRPTIIKSQCLVDQTVEAIHGAAGRSLKEKTEGIPQPLLLALSGGYDSRFIAALCCEHHIRVRAVTYGRRHHIELRTTRAVARALQLDLQVLPQLADGTLRFLPQYLDATEGNADPAAASVLHLLRASKGFGTSLLHGFVGDVPAGVRIADFSAAEYASPERLADAITHRACFQAELGVAGLFKPAVDPDELRRDVLDELRRDCSPPEAFQLWYLENRYRRYVATHCATLGAHFDLVMPFYDRRLLNIWFSIPPVALADRALFKRLIAHFYPMLARIPHSEEPAPIIPNLRWQLTRFYHKLPARLLAASIGAQRADNIRLRLYRHSTFRTLSKLEAPQQQAHMLTRIDQLRPALAQALGLELGSDYRNVLTRDSQALRALFGIACYAARRYEAQQSTPGIDVGSTVPPNCDAAEYKSTAG